MNVEAFAEALRQYIFEGEEPWMDYARCKGMGPDLFFPKRGESKRPGEAVCAACPVVADCGDYADRSGSFDGIWAGVLRNRNFTSQPEPLAASVIEETNDQEVKLLPVSFSATALGVYEECPARYKAEYVDKAPTPGNVFAAIGTACHEAIELWVAQGHYLQEYANEWAVMKPLYDEAYWRVFKDSEKYEDGVKMCQDWLKRQDWTGRTVLSTEQKLFFNVKTSAGEIPFNYVMDRMDKLDNGDIEVVDYKSLSQPVKPGDLKHKIQARAYALAAQLMFPDARRIWVTFDMLRFEPVGIVFTIEENRETWRYLTGLCERVIQDEGIDEVLGQGCRYCVRRPVCAKLNRHVDAGGALGITDPVAAAARLYEVQSAIKGLQGLATDLDAVVVGHMKANDLMELDVPGYEVSVGVSSRRDIDPERLLQVVGPDVMSRYAKINVTSVDAMLKNEPLTDDQKGQVRKLFRQNYGEPSTRIKPAKGLI